MASMNHPPTLRPKHHTTKAALLSIYSIGCGAQLRQGRVDTRKNALYVIENSKLDQRLGPQYAAQVARRWQLMNRHIGDARP
jgi:hypothetical protein